MKKRKELLPKWIRFFSWLFLAFYIAPIILVIGIFKDIKFTLFGLDYFGTSLHPVPIFISGILFFFAITAHGLLWGKDWGVTFGIVSGFIGLLIAISATVYSITSGNINIRLEPLLQIPFLIALFKVKRQWTEFTPPAITCQST